MKRRDMFKLAPVALLGCNSPAIASQSQMKPLVDAWEHAHAQWIAAASKPDAGNFDTPECLHWEAQREKRQEALKSTPLTSSDCVKALLRFIWVDGDAQASWDEYPQVPRWALKTLLEFTGSHDLIGG